MTLKITLPELIFEPKKYSFGYINQLIQREIEVEIEKVEKFKIGPKTYIDCLILKNGEKILVTQKKAIALPVGIHGLLRHHQEDIYTWIDHIKLIEAREKVKKIGLKKYSQDLSSSWPPDFRFKTPSYDNAGNLTPGSQGLRPPQIGALFSIGSHWSLNSQPATIVMPTGTGKTETMLAVLAAFKNGPIIVGVPTKALRRQTARKFLTFGLLRELEILPINASNPVVGILTGQPRKEEDLVIFEECNVVVAAMPSLTGNLVKPFAKKIAEHSGVLIVDEAHHIAAATWLEFRQAFNDKRVLQFTATPFRYDGKLVDGDVIFSYPLRKAQEDGYFKPIKFKPVHEIGKQAADDAIAKEACDCLREDISNGYDHIMMARCDSIVRADEILKLYLKYGKEFFPQIIHSELKDSDKRVQNLLSGKSKIAICVNMLGEGFDLPSLKIAALHDPQKSLAPLLQFTGRFTRSSGVNLGDATVVANIADINVSTALERLYSEDSDWNSLLSEMSSQAAKDHAKFIEFLNESISLENPSDEMPNLSHHLLKPIFSTLVYKCEEFFPKRFVEAIPKGVEIANVWLNEKTKTLFFATRTFGRVKWTRSKEIIDTAWDLYVLHFDEKRKLLYLGSSDKTSMHEKMAQAIGAAIQIAGEDVFRSLGRIGRLVFNNLGVSKHGRRNLSYAMYTGADVRQALSLSEKTGSRKANLSGIGWESGKQVTIGCSYKGRVWSKDAGTIPEFIEWAENVGDKLLDTTISTAEIIDNVLIPDEIKELPQVAILGIEWPYELIKQAEERVVFSMNGNSSPIFMCDIIFSAVDYKKNTISFSIIDCDGDIMGEYSLSIGEEGYKITYNSASDITLIVGSNEYHLVDYFDNYPPLIRFVDLAELDGNLILRPQNAKDLVLPSECLIAHDWAGIDITKESIWKGGVKRDNSIQSATARKFITDGFDFVFDDDSPGEAADLICIKEEATHISLILAHCKFSADAKAGARVEDIVEVSSQAIRSAKWAGKFKELCKHIQNRNERRDKTGGKNFVLRGNLSDVNRLLKVSRFKEVRPQVMLVQPGISIGKISQDQKMVFAAATSYLKETINVDAVILCSK